MIELKHVTKRFDGFAALDDLTMSAPKGSVYGLVGPNGAGKTTAIRHMTGMLRPDEGEVRLCGEDVWENTAVKARMFCIPDEPWFFPMASTRDMRAMAEGLYPAFDVGRYEKLRDVFPIDDRRPLRQLSRGMRKQAAFWLALSARPEVLILDEPVDGLDPVMRRQIWSLILGDVAEYGTTVLVSSHNLRELEDVCDRVGILRKGRCLLEQEVSLLQETTAKIVLALPEGAELPEGLEILHKSSTGKLTTLILRGREEELTERLKAAEPLFMDTQPLSLEEIFIYEMGGADYAVRDILL